jgi:hypothetical protein
MKTILNSTNLSRPKSTEVERSSKKPSAANISERYLEVLRLRQQLSEAEASRNGQ